MPTSHNTLIAASLDSVPCGSGLAGFSGGFARLSCILPRIVPKGVGSNRSPREQ
jgi:hypothetical protein